MSVRSAPHPTAPLSSSFWAYAASVTAAGLGDGVRVAALPLLAASLTASPALVGAVAACQSLPWLLVNPLSGALADRHDRRSLMQLATEVRVVLAVTLVAIVALHLVDIAWLCVLGFLLGSADTMGSNSASGLLPRLVRGPQLERANAISQGGYVTGANLLGPALGALLFTVARELPFSADAVSFGIAGLLLLAVAGPFPPDSRGGGRITTEVVQGARWLWAHHPLRLLAVLVGLQNLAFGMVLSTFVLFVLEVLRVPRVLYGVLLAVMAAGGLLGSLFAYRAGIRLRRPALLRAILAVNGLGLLAIWGLPRIWLVIPVLILLGFLGTLWDVTVVSYRQRETPDALLGRVTSTFRVVGLGAYPVGAALGGVLAQAAGLRVPFLAAGLVMALAVGLSIPGLAGVELSR